VNICTVKSKLLKYRRGRREKVENLSWPPQQIFCAAQRERIIVKKMGAFSTKHFQIRLQKAFPVDFWWKEWRIWWTRTRTKRNSLNFYFILRHVLHKRFLYLPKCYWPPENGLKYANGGRDGRARSEVPSAGRIRQFWRRFI